MSETNRNNLIRQIKEQADLMAYITTDMQLCSHRNGGEYQGPCPFCGGEDRFHVQPYHPSHGRWFCRQCTGDIGDGGKWQDIFDFIQHRDNTDFNNAFVFLSNQITTTSEDATERRQSTKKPDKPRYDFTTPDWQHNQTKLASNAHLDLIYHSTPQAHEVALYLDNRNINETMRSKYNLGAGRFQMIRSRDKQNQPVYQNALVIPWLMPRQHSTTNLTALQYRFIGPKLDPHDRETIIDQRYGSIAGSKRILFGTQFCSPDAHTLIMTEGELNAISIDQVLTNAGSDLAQYDVISWGSQANIKNRLVQQHLVDLIERNKYKRILCFADKLKYAAAVLQVTTQIEHELSSISMIAPTRDANQMLIDDPTGLYLLEYLDESLWPDNRH